MSEVEHKLFTVAGNRVEIKAFIDYLEIASSKPSGFEKERNIILKDLLRDIYDQGEYWDALCQVNAGYIGKTFIDSIKLNDNVPDIEYVYSYTLRFACECYLSSVENQQHIFEFIEFAKQNMSKFDAKVQGRLEYAISFTPIMVTKRVIQGHELKNILQFNEVTQRAQNLKALWDEELKDKKKEVDALKDIFDEQKMAFNFVGLYEGFGTLSEQKEMEKQWSFMWVMLIGAAVLALVGYEFYFVSSQVESVTGGTVSSINYLRFIPMFSGVFILLYFFRIALINYKSVKSQILQIELRKTLCQFVHNYVDFSKDKKTKEVDPLAKFENIIFSGIVADEGNIPSTFDGLDQLTKLAKAMKK